MVIKRVENEAFRLRRVGYVAHMVVSEYALCSYALLETSWRISLKGRRIANIKMRVAAWLDTRVCLPPQLPTISPMVDF